MPIVEVPGHGDVEFPDDMSDDQIAAAIKKNMAVAAPPAKPTTSSGRPAPTSTLGTIGDYVSGIPSRLKELGKGALEMQGSINREMAQNPGETAATLGFLPAGRAALRMAKDAGSSFMENAETRSQAALDQLGLIKGEGGAPPSFSHFLQAPELRESLRQVSHTVVPELETQEVIPGSGGAEVPTGRALGESTVDLAAAEPTVPAKALFGATGRVLPALSDLAAAKLRNFGGIEGAAEHLTALDQPHPLGKLEPHELGAHVGAQEEQVFKLRKSQGNTLYKPVEELPAGVSIKDLLDDDFNLRLPKGVDVPPEIKDALKAVKREMAALPKTEGGALATSPELDLALSKLDDISFKSAHELRKSLSERIRSVDPRNPPPEYHDMKAARAIVQADMESAAHTLSPDDYASWKTAEDFWRKEVADNHYRGPGKAISRNVKGQNPQKMPQVIEKFAPQDVEHAHRTLIPKGDWVAPAVEKSGQKAFDSLIEGKIRTELGAANAGEKIDLTKAAKAIDTKIGRATWEKMKQLASPQQSTRMNNLEQVARAYEKIGAGAEIDPAMAAAQSMGKLTGKGSLLKPFTLFRELKADALRWALEHPARTEILTAGLEGATSSGEAQQFAARNVANLMRLYDMDKGKPPSMPGRGNTMDLFSRELP